VKQIAIVAVVAIASLLLGSGLSRAQSKYGVYGHGNQSCGQWTEKNNKIRDTYLHTWVIGFVSGAGFVAPTPLRTTDAAGMAAWIDTYCAAHPLDNLAQATGMLVTELQRPQ
jgi:hypothetical protein